MSGSQLKQFTNSVCFGIGRGDSAWPPGQDGHSNNSVKGGHTTRTGQGEVTITASDSHRSKLAGLVVFGEQIVNVFSLH